MGAGTHCGICRHPRASGTPGMGYQVSIEVGKSLDAPGGSRNGSAKLGDRPGGVDLGTDLPGGPRTVQMYVYPSIDLVDRLHGLRMLVDRLRKERER